jgi:Cu/Ag efflux protein CusF
MRKFPILLASLAMTTLALAQSTPLVKGTVTKVDAGADKITIKHEPIPNLDMGQMTMVFKPASADMVKQVKAGDTIHFTADRVNGQITITSIKKP